MLVLIELPRQVGVSHLPAPPSKKDIPGRVHKKGFPKIPEIFQTIPYPKRARHSGGGKPRVRG